MDTEYVHLEHAPPILRIHLPGRALLVSDPGVCAKEIDGPELRLDPLDHRLDLLSPGDVGDDGEPVDLTGDSLDLLARAGADRDARARGRELTGDVRADPAPAPGHQRHLSVQAIATHRSRLVTICSKSREALAMSSSASGFSSDERSPGSAPRAVARTARRTIFALRV